ncbi:MAG: hypothetical protein ACOYEV_09530 [Candidatus Nanopelagicales bacterium]
MSIALAALDVRALAELQDPDGCFPSEIRTPDGLVRPDRNIFLTALVLRELRRLPPSAERDEIRDRGLTWISQGAAASPPGSYGFWPAGQRPRWAAGLPPDADDTAVVTTELLLAGWLDRSRALRTACVALLPHRLRERQSRPSWVCEGTFLTWLRPDQRANPVDLVVTANVLALLALLDARHLPGYYSGVRTVLACLPWAGQDPVRLAAATPFYARSSELVAALDHAVACGVSELGDASAAAHALPSSPTAFALRSAFGRTAWRAEALDLARTLAASARAA